MALVIVRHRIEDYTRWKLEFDAFVEARRAAGEKSFRIAHAPDNKNNLCLVFDWDSAANAKRFVESPALAAAMQRAGVCEKPDISIAEDIVAGRT